MGYSEVLNALNIYFKTIESKNINNLLSSPDRMNTIFECCHFLEQAISKAEAENITLCQEVVNKWLRNHKKPVNYDCSYLKTVCDELLRVCLKRPELPTELVKDLLSVYLFKLGRERLALCLEQTLLDSFSANAILHALTELGTPISGVENHVLLLLWERSAQMGQKDELQKNLHNFLNNDKLPLLVEMAGETECPNARKIILKFFITILNHQDAAFFRKLSNVDVALVSKVTCSDDVFRDALIDNATHFCSKIKKVHGSWASDTDVEYRDILKVLKALFIGDVRTRDVVNETIQVRKSLDESNGIWEQIEIDCIW